MRHTKRIPREIEGLSFFSKKAGSFSNTPQSTVQLWTEKGLLAPEIADTTGTGKRRLYSALNTIEIAIIKQLSDRGVDFKTIAKVIDFFHRNEDTTRLKLIHTKYLYVNIGPEKSNLEKLLDEERGFIFIEYYDKDQIEISGQGISEEDARFEEVYDDDGIIEGAQYFHLIPEIVVMDVEPEIITHILYGPISSGSSYSTIVNINGLADKIINKIKMDS